MAISVCSVCGHIEFSDGFSQCPVCASPQDKFEQNERVFAESEEQSKEAAAKHIPSVKVVKECGLVPGAGCTDVLVRVGEVVHPMEEAHYITFIDCYVDDKYIARTLLTPGSFPAVVFHLKASGSKVRIVERCNKHGWWQAEADL